MSPRAAKKMRMALSGINVAEWNARGAACESRDLHISQPRELTCFTRAADRTVAYGSRAGLRRFRMPPDSANLNVGYENFVDKVEDDSGINPILEALKQIDFKFDEEADFVTFRNNLNKICLTPYNKRDKWEIDVCRLANTHFLDIRKLDEGPMQEFHKRMCFQGYRFEQLCTNDPSCTDTINCNEEFCSLVRLRVGQHRIVLAAEIDSEDIVPGRKGLDRYVELKTLMNPEKPFQYDRIREQKFLKFWIQSYLSGTPAVFVGYRSKNGGLVRNERLRTRDLPSFAAGKWSPHRCLNFLDSFLSLVKETFSQEATEGSVVRYALDPSKQEISATDVTEDSGFRVLVSGLLGFKAEGKD